MRRCLSTFSLTVCIIAAMAQQVSDTTPAKYGSVAHISKAGTDQYVMQFTEYDFGTLYLDFPVSIPTGKNGVRGVYYISSIEGGEAFTERIRGNIPAYTAVMVHGNHNKTYVFERTNANVQPIEGNLLSGSLVDISVEDALTEAGASSNAVVLTYGKPKEMGYMGFYRYTGKTLKANKAFIIYEPGAGGSSNELTIKGLDDDADAVAEVLTPTMLDEWHTLQGIRLYAAPTQKGIYIHNGKTVVVNP